MLEAFPAEGVELLHIQHGQHVAGLFHNTFLLEPGQQLSGLAKVPY
jgi:hypothetical protein